MMTTPIRVLLCDDHTILREGLASLLATAPDIQVVGQAADGIEAIELALKLRPQVVVTDISMPKLNGIEVVRRLGQQLPEARVLVLTMHTEEEYVLHLIRAGAAGYLLKDSAGTELLSAVRAIARGRGYFGTHAARVMAQQVQQPQSRLEDPYRDLTDREREVFHLVIEGLTTKEIARRLDIAVKTAENHRTRAMEKLDAKNVAELIRYAVRHRLMD
ncbi:MAG: response regulator transcription factor [Rhodanobacteraceae bacterium]|jgi:DNA-binding NarL/FixJ family response regulator|nr:response regulator transcription factor [Rhodanobacteraceae bacterium]MBL0041877.1 response regulator transcription factor [Xanthomonadales bacterium]MBP6078361.1 response regulator transcription factor [Xanthomonadales bacterium]MBP7625314.1 response regulator transcription factor [Xanthomonadales bacterium]